MTASTFILLAVLAVASALPADPIIAQWDPENPRYTYMRDDEGNTHIVDNAMKISDLFNIARYNPDRTNAYHLFTWRNPTISYPLVMNDENRLRNSHFGASKRTVVLMHGFLGSITSSFNTVLVPAFLSNEDCNVIVVDWSAGSSWGPNAGAAAESAARFFDWLNRVSGANPSRYHVVGFSVGGHGAGIISRRMNGNVAYLTSLDPAFRWDASTAVRRGDSRYTEVIHTNAGDSGVLEACGHVDFYPNGGTTMPGCMTALCHHERCFHYFGESIRRGGFTGRRCNSVADAQRGNCNSGSNLRMGGRNPKTGTTGIYHLVTNSQAPFSRS